MVDPSSTNPQPPSDVAGFLHRDASGDSSLLPEPDPAKDRRMESMQSSLVERIAAVDDERRRSAAQTHRALETQREEVALQMRHQRLLVFLIMGLMILLTLAVVGYVHVRMQGMQTQLSDGLTQLREELAGFAAAPAAEATTAIDTEAVSRLSAQTSALDSQVGSIRQRLAALVVDVAELKAMPEPPLTPEPLPSSSEPQPTSLKPPSAEAAQMKTNQSGEPAPDRRSLDEVVEDLRPAAVEREDQRPETERRVPSSAVSPRDEAEGNDEGRLRPSAADLQGNEPVAADATVEAGGADGESDAAAPSTIKVGARPIALQLIGFHNPELLDAFIARSPLPAEVYTREERFRGRPWFVLIHSLHPDRDSARAASDALPDALTSLDLWLRELPDGAELQVIDTSGRAP